MGYGVCGYINVGMGKGVEGGRGFDYGGGGGGSRLLHQGLMVLLDNSVSLITTSNKYYLL